MDKINAQIKRNTFLLLTDNFFGYKLKDFISRDEQTHI